MGAITGGREALPRDALKNTPLSIPMGWLDAETELLSKRSYPTQLLSRGQAADRMESVEGSASVL